METQATAPVGIQGLNWGAFLLHWIWGIGNQVWISLLVFVPCIGIAVPFYLLFKGNELAWNGPRQWESEEQFQAVQAAWMKWGLVALVVYVIVGFIYGATFFAMLAAAIGGASSSPR